MLNMLLRRLERGLCEDPTGLLDGENVIGRKRKSNVNMSDSRSYLSCELYVVCKGPDAQR